MEDLKDSEHLFSGKMQSVLQRSLGIQVMDLLFCDPCWLHDSEGEDVNKY